MSTIPTITGPWGCDETQLTHNSEKTVWHFQQNFDENLTEENSFILRTQNAKQYYLWYSFLL